MFQLKGVIFRLYSSVDTTTKQNNNYVYSDMFRLKGVIFTLYSSVNTTTKRNNNYVYSNMFRLKGEHCLLPTRLFTPMHVERKVKSKGTAIPLQAWTGPEGSRRLRFPDFKTIGTLRW